MVCRITQERSGRFIVWFCSKDYDSGNQTLRSLGLYEDLFGLWEDTGLIDENNNPRLSMNTWEMWFYKKMIN
jgi:hypothetical protein